MSLESSEWIFINWNQVSWSCWSKIKSVRWASCFTRPSRIRTGPCRVRTNFSLPVGQKRKFSRKRILQPRRKELAHKLLDTYQVPYLSSLWLRFLCYLFRVTFKMTSNLNFLQRAKFFTRESFMVQLHWKRWDKKAVDTIWFERKMFML